jgi:hypothetical protein
MSALIKNVNQINKIIHTIGMILLVTAHSSCSPHKEIRHYRSQSHYIYCAPSGFDIVQAMAEKMGELSNWVQTPISFQNMNV